MVIQLPILFALYQVIYAVPAYVDSINSLYMQIAEANQPGARRWYDCSGFN